MKLEKSIFSLILSFSVVVIVLIFLMLNPPTNRTEIYKEQKELIQTQKRLIQSLRKDLSTIVHYPESQQAEHIIYRVRVNALADSMLLNFE